MKDASTTQLSAIFSTLQHSSCPQSQQWDLLNSLDFRNKKEEFGSYAGVQRINYLSCAFLKYAIHSAKLSS